LNFHLGMWYAVRVRSRHEQTAVRALEARKFPCYLPLYRARRRWSDRTKVLDLPLFPGYVFCNFQPEDQSRIVKAPGVVSVLNFGGKLVPVNTEELQHVEVVAKSGLDIMPLSQLVSGARVYLEDGPLRGMEGVVTWVRNTFRLVVSVTLLQRAVSVEIEREWIRPERLIIPSPKRSSNLPLPRSA